MQVDHHGSRGADPERLRRGRIEDLVDGLQLEKVIARAQRAELAGAALLGTRRNGARIGAWHRPGLLGNFKVLGPAVSLVDGPGRAAAKHSIHRLVRQSDAALGPHARGHGAEERIQDLVKPRTKVRLREVRADEPHSTVDVKTDAARRYHPVAHVGRRHAADRKPVAPMHVGHGQRVPDDAGQERDVRQLLQRLVGQDAGKHRLG